VGEAEVPANQRETRGKKKKKKKNGVRGDRVLQAPQSREGHATSFEGARWDEKTEQFGGRKNLKAKRYGDLIT